MYKKYKGENTALFQGSKVPTLQSVQDAGGISALAIVCQIALEAKRTGGSDAIFSFPLNRGDVCHESDAEATARVKASAGSGAILSTTVAVPSTKPTRESDSDNSIPGTGTDDEMLADLEEAMDDAQEEYEGVVEKIEDGDDAASDGEGSDGAVAKLAASRKKELIGEKKGLKGKLRDAQRAKRKAKEEGRTNAKARKERAKRRAARESAWSALLDEHAAKMRASGGRDAEAVTADIEMRKPRTWETFCDRAQNKTMDEDIAMANKLLQTVCGKLFSELAAEGQLRGDEEKYEGKPWILWNRMRNHVSSAHKGKSRPRLITDVFKFQWQRQGTMLAQLSKSEKLLNTKLQLVRAASPERPFDTEMAKYLFWAQMQEHCADLFETSWATEDLPWASMMIEARAKAAVLDEGDQTKTGTRALAATEGNGGPGGGGGGGGGGGRGRGGGGRGGGGSGKRNAQCYHCAQLGHQGARCPAKSKAPACMKCLQPGHLVKDCKNNRKEPQHVDGVDGEAGHKVAVATTAAVATSVQQDGGAQQVSQSVLDAAHLMQMFQGTAAPTQALHAQVEAADGEQISRGATYASMAEAVSQSGADDHGEIVRVQVDRSGGATTYRRIGSK